jgi:hypothetical protein
MDLSDRVKVTRLSEKGISTRQINNRGYRSGEDAETELNKTCFRHSRKDLECEGYRVWMHGFLHIVTTCPKRPIDVHPLPGHYIQVSL